MLTLTFYHVLLQTISCALLMVMSPTWLVAFISVDVGLFFLYKLARRDFYYYLNIRGGVRDFISFLMRVCAKLLASFTLLIQLRHPQDCGGLPFLGSVLYSLVGSFAAVYLYLNQYEGSSKIDTQTLYTILTILHSV